MLTTRPFPTTQTRTHVVPMTGMIFSMWLEDWDSELGQNSRKIRLLIDNATSQPSVDLKNIHEEFLPPNTNSLSDINRLETYVKLQ